MKKHLIILAATSLLSVSSVSAAGMYARVGGGAYYQFKNTSAKFENNFTDISYSLVPNGYSFER